MGGGGECHQTLAPISNERIGPTVLGLVFFELLDPGGATAPAREDTPYVRSFGRVVLPVRTNPAAQEYCGLEARHLPMGSLTLVNHSAMCWAVNFGDAPRISLVTDWRVLPKQEAEG